MEGICNYKSTNGGGAVTALGAVGSSRVALCVGLLLLLQVPLPLSTGSNVPDEDQIRAAGWINS